jgi:thiol-disulfide isomerase/thioredoxin
MKPTTLLISLFALTLMIAGVNAAEYTGQFESTLVANSETEQQVIFKPDTGDRLKNAGELSPTAHIVMGKLQDPQTLQYTVLAYLVEEKGKEPVLYADSNDDHAIAADEKYLLKRGVDDTYLWSTTVLLKVKDGGMFKTCPINVKYIKGLTMEKMGPEDRYLEQSKETLAGARVNIKGKEVLFRYTYSFLEKKVDPQNGVIGVDINSDGEVDMDELSPEAATAEKETVVFRIGDTYVSTKKADIGANQVVIREHSAGDYKRAELYIKKPFPDFAFTDFDGKKHRFSEFRGKYVLLDIWGFWCGPCRRELPYIREANRRFSGRNLQVVGLNTDEDFTLESMKKSLADNQMTWPQAQRSSVEDFLKRSLRVHSFPTTFLISPDGNILSMGRSDRDEPVLRGSELLKTLDELLPSS